MTRRTFAACAGPLALAACGSRKQPSFDYGEAKQHFAMKGVVLRLKPEFRVAVIRHENIEGWMEAMTMEFPVPSPAEFAKLKEGMTITAGLEVNDLHYWLINIKPQS
jgi:Cu/Ag efflux protein CusF